MNNFTKYRDTLSNSDDDSDIESILNNDNSINFPAINFSDLCNENLLYSSDDEHEVVDPLFNLVKNTQGYKVLFFIESVGLALYEGQNPIIVRVIAKK